MKLKNKVCVVTGGAMGNGLGIVKVFLKYGAKVSIIDYDESINDIVVKLNNEGYNVIGFYADIRDKEKVDEAIFKTKEIFGNIDVLVNNGICSSKREAREFITNGSITVNGEKITDLDYVINKDKCIENKYFVIRRGKKKYYLGTM